MGWNLTSLAARAGTTLGMRRSFNGAYAARAAAGLAARGERAEGDTVFARVASRRRASLAGADAKAVDAAYDEIAGDAAVLDRALASGAPLSAVASLAAAWGSLSESARGIVRDPVGRSTAGRVTFGSVHATQVDATTCGAASMGLMLMMGDPFVALWLATGRTLGAYLPPEVLSADVAAGFGRTGTIEERWHALQRVLHAKVTSGALLVASWPRSLGTPPWRVDDATRYAGLRFRGELVDDADPRDVAALVAHASAALRDGIPVPLYVGGDSSGGLDAVVPRHVVLAVAREEDHTLVYEPGAGALRAVGDNEWRAGGGRRAAFGQWSRVTWVVLPRMRMR